METLTCTSPDSVPTDLDPGCLTDQCACISMRIKSDRRRRLLSSGLLVSELSVSAFIKTLVLCRALHVVIPLTVAYSVCELVFTTSRVTPPPSPPPPPPLILHLGGLRILGGGGVQGPTQALN